MDVKPGHCWCCEKRLPQRTVPCSRCPVTVYCTTSCRDRDEARHDAIECQTFRTKKCSSCGELGETLECQGCNDAWYCDTNCQRLGWPSHKAKCKETVAVVKQLSLKLQRQSHVDFPCYVGNTIAEDFLQLENNELAIDRMDKEQLIKDFHVLSTGCGNLRNTVLTAASLPVEYQGKLNITLNDHDPFVMARNVLFLFMLVRFADTDYIAPSLTTIWYSLHLSQREYDLVKTSLDELIQMSAQQLHDVTKGLVTLLNEDLFFLRFVWESWRGLECQRDKASSINLRQQRKKWFDTPFAKKNQFHYPRRLNEKDRKKMEEWFEHGLFFPYEANEKDMPFENPTLTAPKASTSSKGEAARKFILQTYSQAVRQNASFLYCIFPTYIPFEAWDCLRVREQTPGSHSSPMVMYHKYVTNLLKKVKSLILQGRLLIHVSLANCLDFPNHHQTLDLPNCDRIFTSNLADYVGIPRLLHSFKPLLNASNSCSAIVTETIRWMDVVPSLCINSGTGMPESNNPLDVFSNIPHFVQYLRADIMAGGVDLPAQQKVPSFKSVKKYHGLQMRDFRKRQNKLVPFQYQIYKRDLNSKNVCDRAVEWCLPTV